MLEQDEKATADTAALEKQKRHLQTSKSRLIDSYTEGVIEKHDFDPKMQQLKVKLQQIDRQIAASREHAAGQFELFLVINRLEEFAAAVNDRLSTIDFTTKREIIRALVKRIEIHKDEIVVVFRVDPDPGLQSGDGSANSKGGRSIMQDRTRRSDPALRCPFLGQLLRAVLQRDRGLEPPLDVQKHPAFLRVRPHRPHHQFMIDSVEGLHDTIPITTT